jgi:4-hydroxybenzoate polyprenyltransferase
VVPVVGFCYAATWLLLLGAGLAAGLGAGFIAPALIAAVGFAREWLLLRRDEALASLQGSLQSGIHFQRQVLLGALMLFALILGRY